ncbi:MAG TPA: TetR/AcrR family transcriptional regulator [Spirochaetota bacterium]|nr:TetR/AcrR family transcriptional regulator [Spirochaetota bacterium]HPS87516.1 TetR/AcrR family transcriptional regulator [Spirochaetota bacterium]
MDENEKICCGRQQEIIEAAQKVFAEYGYKKVTMDDVAAKLNITRSALYYYYKSKEELFIAVGEYDFRKYKSDIQEAIGTGQTTEERFTAFCRCFLPMRKQFRDLYKLGYDDFFFPLGTHLKFKNMVGDIHKSLIKDIFLKDEKIFNKKNLEYYAALLTYSIRGIVFSSYDAPIEQLERDIVTLCKIFCQGLPEVASSAKNDQIKKDK